MPKVATTQVSFTPILRRGDAKLNLRSRCKGAKTETLAMSVAAAQLYGACTCVRIATRSDGIRA